MAQWNLCCYFTKIEVYKNTGSCYWYFVKTISNGYIPIIMIGTTKLYNSGNNLRGVNRLYKCSKNKYPQLTEDLFITGYHSILVETSSKRNLKELSGMTLLESPL
jgi:hypothetical protein